MLREKFAFPSVAVFTIMRNAAAVRELRAALHPHPYGGGKLHPPTLFHSWSCEVSFCRAGLESRSRVNPGKVGGQLLWRAHRGIEVAIIGRYSLGE